jgi:hypothetical protein
LLPSPALVADLDGADGEDDGDDKEEDSADKTWIKFKCEFGNFSRKLIWHLGCKVGLGTLLRRPAGLEYLINAFI